jgi:uncharacterized protein
MIAEQFKTIITQPTTLCNMDCGYCYLPARKQSKLMAPLVAEAVASSVVSQGSDLVDIVWHCGEPLATPIDHMRNLLEPFALAKVRHSTQTNATLVDDKWCELLIEYGFLVGISIDGPAAYNAARVDWSGKETFARTMYGISRLRDAGIPYTAICVVTADTIDQPDELVEFFTALGCESVGFNLEEKEGVNQHRRVITAEQAQRFWRRLWQLHEAGSQLPIRDLDRVRDWLFARRLGNLTYNTDPAGPIPTVGHNGDVVMLSPELLGIQDSKHRNFTLGNVLRDSLPDIISRAMSATYVKDFRRGLEACQATCGFWDFCRGAHAGNRYFENGSFDSTETAHCRNTKQALIHATLTHLAGEEVMSR